MPTPPPPARSRRHWTGWVGVAAVVVWMGIASMMSPSAIEAIDGPLPFAVVALVLFGVMQRWAPPRTSSAFARLGGVVLLAWLLESFTAASAMNWGEDPWLIRAIETFHHADHTARLLVIAVAITLVSSVSRRREVWVLGPLAIVTTVAAVKLEIPGAVVFGGIWWAGRALRGVATRRFTATIALVTALGTAPESVAVLCGYGGSYGSDLFALFAHPLGAIACGVAMIGLVIAGGVALRRRRVVQAGRLWTTGIGCGGIVVGYAVLGGCSDIVLGAGPLLLLLVAGPRTRWSPVLWGSASVLASSLVVAEQWDSPRHVVAGLILIVAATVAFALMHRVVVARREVASGLNEV